MILWITPLARLLSPIRLVRPFKVDKAVQCDSSVHGSEFNSDVIKIIRHGLCIWAPAAVNYLEPLISPHSP